MSDELDLIDRIARIAATRPGVVLGIGDDAAVLDGDPPAVVTQDLLVDGIHFRRSTTGLGDLGHKALAVNLSDLAAMGAAPVAALVGLGVPADGSLGQDGVAELYTGMEALAAAHGVTIAGGDVTRSPALMLAVTAIGHALAGVAPLRRSGAGAGDLVCVTGALGAAGAGLLILDDPSLADGVAEAGELRRASLRPTPRVTEGQRLAAGGATAMIDCSDGLALDVSRIGEASGVGIEIDLARVPMAAGVAAVAAAAGREADLLAATGGEDYELVATVPEAALPGLAATLDVPLTPVGRAVAEAGVRLLRDGRQIAVGRLGWEH